MAVWTLKKIVVVESVDILLGGQTVNEFSPLWSFFRREQEDQDQDRGEEEAGI